jgi:hypothetical protein
MEGTLIKPDRLASGKLGLITPEGHIKWIESGR